jgi:histidyl-tRNA synthetase
VLVTHLEGATLRHVLGILDNLRTTGINAEIYFEPERLEKQLQYARRKEIPFVVICGPDEIRRGESTIRAMKTGKQKIIPQNQLITYLKGFVHAANT